MLFLLVLGMLEVPVVVVVVLVEGIFKWLRYFIQKCHGPTSPGLRGLWGAVLHTVQPQQAREVEQEVWGEARSKAPWSPP